MRGGGGAGREAGSAGARGLPSPAQPGREGGWGGALRSARPPDSTTLQAHPTNTALSRSQPRQADLGRPTTPVWWTGPCLCREPAESTGSGSSPRGSLRPLHSVAGGLLCIGTQHERRTAGAPASRGGKGREGGRASTVPSWTCAP